MSKDVKEKPRHSLRRRTTIVDVAEHLNLAKGTVSRALNGYSDISESTRLRVRKAADRLGYRPLSHAQAIRTGRVRSVGLVLQISEHDGHRPFLADFLAGLSASASRADWTMTVATAASDDDTGRIMTKLAEERKVDGFILPRTYEHDRRVDTLRTADVPFVLFGRVADLGDAPYFDIESEAAMHDAVTLLAGLGHERIAFVQGGAAYMYSRLRREGYKAGLRDAGLGFDQDLVARPAVNRASGADAALHLLRLDQPPTALIYAVDRAALGAYDAAETLGLTIGRDISVIGYDGIPESALIRPPLSTFSVDMRHAGARLVELLIRLSDGGAPETMQELGRARFIARASHGPCTMSPAALAKHITTLS